ncbi:MAG TPA: response regulator transcription factor [Geobacteraceae bacterium]|nr:response regulator transcription factor [Geobacteraceae bacterium]
MFGVKIPGPSTGERGFPAAVAKKIFFYSGWKKPNLPVIGYLREGGYCVEQIVGWRDAAIPLPNREPDLVILDFDLTQPESLTALIKIREAFQGPLVALSDCLDDIYHILALDLGADDFLGGQANRALITARIKALLRRDRSGRRDTASGVMLGNLVIYPGRREVTIDGRFISLTSVEFDLLLYLGQKAGTVVSRCDLYRTVLNREFDVGNRTVDMYMARLRKKLGDDRGGPRVLKTVRGAGYLMSAHVS